MDHVNQWQTWDNCSLCINATFYTFFQCAHAVKLLFKHGLVQISLFFSFFFSNVHTFGRLYIYIIALQNKNTAVFLKHKTGENTTTIRGAKRDQWCSTSHLYKRAVEPTIVTNREQKKGFKVWLQDSEKSFFFPRFCICLLLNPLPLFSFLNDAQGVLDCLHAWFDVDKNVHFCHCKLKKMWYIFLNTNVQGLEFLGATRLWTVPSSGHPP